MSRSEDVYSIHLNFASAIGNDEPYRLPYLSLSLYADALIDLTRRKERRTVQHWSHRGLIE